MAMDQLHRTTLLAGWCLTLLVLHGVQSSQTPRVPGATVFNRPLQYWQSHELGVTRCRLLGVLNGVDVTLHVWLRVVPPPHAPQPPACATMSESERRAAGCGRHMHVRGAAFLQDHRDAVPYKSPMIQMVQSLQMMHFAGKRVYLRSTTTNQTYPLTVRLPPLSPKPVDLNPKQRKVLATNHIIDITGLVPLHPEDATDGLLDMELRVEGFQWYCDVIAGPPVLGRGPGAAPSHASAPASDPSSQLSGTTRPGSGLPEPGPWTHQTHASLTHRTQVWVLLAPYHGVSLYHYALTLWYHVIWHKVLGVSKYLLYVTERLGQFLREPLIQALIQQDVLEVVLFTELSKHEHQLYTPDLRDVYAMQVIQYNHAALALWGSDVLLMVVDLDEYLVTAQPLSVVDMVRECTTEGRQQAASDSAGISSQEPQVVAGVQLPRYDATCRKRVDLTLCDPGIPNNRQWLQSTQQLLAVLNGSAPHPLDYQTFQIKVTKFQWDQKPLLDPGSALDVHVHDFVPAPGTMSFNASRKCARLLHLLDFYSVRHRGKRHVRVWGETDTDSRHWFWPARKLQEPAGASQAVQ